jgi:hypothetical protein
MHPRSPLRDQRDVPATKSSAQQQRRRERIVPPFPVGCGHSPTDSSGMWTCVMHQRQRLSYISYEEGSKLLVKRRGNCHCAPRHVHQLCGHTFICQAAIQASQCVFTHDGQTFHEKDTACPVLGRSWCTSYWKSFSCMTLHHSSCMQETDTFPCPQAITLDG